MDVVKQPLRAYHSDPKIKAKYLARVEAHRIADEIVQATGYYEKGPDGKVRTCAVGCTIHGSVHSQYEPELGIPASLAFLEDAMFEGMPAEDARVWPGRFLEAIPVGADLSLVTNRFLLWMLESPEIGLLRIADDAGKEAIHRVADLHRRTVNEDRPSDKEWAAAWAAARAAAWDAAGDAAGDAARAAAGDAAGDAAWAAARAAAWKTMSEQLLVLLSEATTS